jgi:ZIP family zinc transporter
VSIDLFSDGVMIGTGTVLNPALGLLLALGQVPADVRQPRTAHAPSPSAGVRLPAGKVLVPILLRPASWRCCGRA